MRKRSSSTGFRCLLCLGAATVAFVAMAPANRMAILSEKYVMLERQLRQDPFKRPLVLDSAETPHQLARDIYALVDYPFSVQCVSA
jgi:hypothetical protein